MWGAAASFPFATGHASVARIISMRWLLLASLTFVSALAAVALAQRTRPSGRAELSLTTCILWQAVLGCPIYALGFTGHFDCPALAVASGTFSAIVLCGAAWRFVRRLRARTSGRVVQLARPLLFRGVALAEQLSSLCASRASVNLYGYRLLFHPFLAAVGHALVPRDDRWPFDPKPRIRHSQPPGPHPEGERVSPLLRDDGALVRDLHGPPAHRADC